MPRIVRPVAVAAASFALLAANSASAQEWPQWRGPNRDGKATGFEVPDTWPEELTQQWKVTVGEGVATPALVSDRLYVFSRQEGNEVVRCLHAETGEEIWKDEYATAEIRGPGSRFRANPHGPRSSPVVADGKVVTLGVQEMLSCYDAATGDLLWRVDEFEGAHPPFYTSSSPIVVDRLCIAQLGGEDEGGVIAAYDLASGEEKWRWSGESPEYGSPVVMTINGTQAIIAPIARSMVAIDASEGRLLWKIPYEQGRYNAATPIVDGQTLVVAGPGSGITAFRLEKRDDELASEKIWGNTDNSVIYNTPVLKDGLLFGFSTGNQFFCMNTETGDTEWTVSASGEVTVEQPAQGRRGGGRRGGRGRGLRGYGSIVDAGSVMLALPFTGQLIVFEPSDEYNELARYKVSDTETHAYPVAVGNRIYIKDQDTVTLWTIE